ncbi:MAG: type II toxin-antitoxin system YafQ family toxin [Lachnospiraceae bacterium]|nr:type II toxin-antitoxin system YafQ family toxin [Lachnospiraceae bacterium]
MLDVRYSTKFKKDFKACKKRGYNLDLLQNIIDTLRIPALTPICSECS